jgi:hypothetical protein
VRGLGPAYNQWSLLEELGKTALWMALWVCSPAVLLYPIALWAAKHTQVPTGELNQYYCIAVALLFFPTAFLVHYIVRFILHRREKTQTGASEHST